MPVGHRREHASKFKVWTGANLPINSGVATRIDWGAKIFDTLNEFDNVTTFGFTPTHAGYYFFHLMVRFTNLNAGDIQQDMIYQNALMISGRLHTALALVGDNTHSSILLYVVPTDVITVYVQHNKGAVANLAGNPSYCCFEGFRVY